MAKTYDTYKDSGIAWIGEIPSEWEVKRLKFSCKLYGRIGFRGYTVDDLVDENNGAITLSPTNFDGISLNFSKCSYLSWAKYEESPEIMVNVGDVLIVKTASVGKCAYVSSLPKECTVNPQILVLKEHKDCAKYIAYIFQTELGQSYIEITKGGSTIFTISQEKIGNYSFMFPPISEQQSIASFLDTKCGEIDALISLQEEMISELQAYKQSVITETVTKGINPNAKMKDSGVEWIGEIPEEWKVCRLKNCITINSGDALSNEKIKEFGEYPVFGGGEMIGYFDNYNTESNELIIGRVGARCGCVTMPNCSCWATDNALKVVSDMPLRFLYYLLISAELNTLNTSNAQPLITATKIKNKVMPMPSSIADQQSIATYLDEKTSQIDSLISLKQQKIEELKDYKKSIIYEYVTGKKRV